MKKFIPYILIVAMIGTFGWLSFASSISNARQAEAGTVSEILKVFGAMIWKTSAIGVVSDTVGVTDSSNWGDWGTVADATIGQMLAWIASFTWYVSSKIFTLSGYLLDYAVDFSVKDFKSHIDNITVINTGYKMVLNVANMFFIFILLYIAVKTILGVGGNMKKLLTNIILVGLLINFSLFMTKAIIDASNIVAMGFYNGVQTEAGQANLDGTDKKIIAVGSISTSMMAGMRLQTQIPASNSVFNEEDPYKGLTNFNIAINKFGGSVLLLVSAFVFLSVALLFIVRFVALLFYLIFSPVAFLGLISPEMKEYSSKWWKGLQSQVMFAPAFLFMAYLISAIINSGQLWVAVGGDTDSASNFHDVISATGQVGGFSIIMNYVILVALMIGALIAAKDMAGKGSAGITKYTNKFQGWAQGIAGRNTIGRAAYLAGNNRYMGKLMAKSPTVGTFVKTRFDNVAGRKFGKESGVGYADALKKSIEKKKKTADFVAKSKVAKTDNLIRKEEDRLDNMESMKELKNNTEKAQKERDRLSGIANVSYKPADFVNIANFERDVLAREEALLENRIEAESRIKDLASYKKKAQEKMKKEYAKNIEFASWGLGPLDKIFRSGADAAAEIRKSEGGTKEKVTKLVDQMVKEGKEVEKQKEKVEKEEKKSEE